MVQMSAASLPDVIYQWLTDAIYNGHFRQGQMIRQDDLAKRFNVSRVPIREALQRLEGDGLVGLIPRRGYAVRDLDPAEIEDIFDLRMMIEGRAAHDSTQNRSGSDIALARSLLDKMDELDPLEEADGIAQWSSLNLQFHDALLTCGSKHHTKRLARTLRGLVEPYIRMEAALTGGLEEAQCEHRELFAAFETGDADTVARLSQEHCEHTAMRLLDGLRRRNQPDS